MVERCRQRGRDTGVAYPTATGEGCFVLPDAAGKNVTVTLDTNNNEVTFTINN